MGEQYVDLFAAGAYALNAALLHTLAGPSMAWLFYLLAAAGVVAAMMQSALEGPSQFWLRHLAAVSVASVLILMPHRIELSSLTYASPGTIETLFGTRTGAAPHLTYLVERLGAAVAAHVRDLASDRPTLAVPAVAAQVEDLASNPAVLEDAQLKANLQMWRQIIVPRLLAAQPDLDAAIRQADLAEALMNPAPSDDRWTSSRIVQRASAVRTILASSRIDLAATVADTSVLLKQIADAAGADAWVAEATSVRIRAATQPVPTVDPPSTGSPAYYDAVLRGEALAQEMTGQLAQANGSVEVARFEQLHELLGRSILYAAAVGYLRQESRLATLGSHCQRLGIDACRAAQAPLIRASAALRVPAADRYNTAGWTTLFQQPLATVLLAVTSLLLGALASLVVAVLPFLLGVAKAIAILMSTVGLWMMLWPGRLRDAISWMVMPVAFVALWDVLFNLWAQVETYLSAIGSAVGHADGSSFSAGRIMSIAISIGYLGLPAIALAILSGNALRALNHAGARLETALMMAWRTRRAATSFGRRWLSNSPLARRWNQRVYRAVGLGTLRSSRPVPRPKRPAPVVKAGPASRKNPAAPQPGGSKPAPPEDFKLE